MPEMKRSRIYSLKADVFVDHRKRYPYKADVTMEFSISDTVISASASAKNPIRACKKAIEKAIQETETEERCEANRDLLRKMGISVD